MQFENLNVGQAVAFDYSESSEDTQRKGVVVDVRDCERHPVENTNWPTLRSRFLVYVEEAGGKVRAFYDCNMSNFRLMGAA
jgi:hypothetical protein